MYHRTASKHVVIQDRQGYFPEHNAIPINVIFVVTKLTNLPCLTLFINHDHYKDAIVRISCSYLLTFHT